MSLSVLEVLKAEAFGLALACLGELLLIFSVIKVATFLPAEALDFFVLFFLANLIAILFLTLGGYCAGAKLMMAFYEKQDVDQADEPPEENGENYSVSQGSVS